MSYSPMRWRALALCAAFFLTLLGGCASTGNPRDPFEPLNRGVYKFNDGVDHLVLKPAAVLYRGVVPEIVRTGIGNFFSNINDVIVALNNLLQGKFAHAVSDVGRIVVNTTVGLLGVLDVATEFGLEKHNEDFGQTLGYWGVGSGPYLVLPFLGPSSVRDGIGLLADWKTDPKSYVRPPRARNQVFGLYFLNRRSELLDTSRILDIAALDPYEFLRDAYLQRRRNLVHDGTPPEEDDIEIRIKSGRGKPDAAPLSANGGGGPTQVTGGQHPVQAEPEPAQPAEKAVTPAAPPRAETSQDPPPARKASVVRLWLPFSRN